MSSNHYSPHSSSIYNTDANIISALTYILPIVISLLPPISGLSWFIPLVIFFIEKNSNLVKFHCVQSICLHLVRLSLILIISVFKIIPFLGTLVTLILSGIVSLIFLVITIFVIIRAYNYDEYKLPIIGDFVANLLK